MHAGGQWQLYAIIRTRIKVKENGKSFQISSVCKCAWEAHLLQEQQE